MPPDNHVKKALIFSLGRHRSRTLVAALEEKKHYLGHQQLKSSKMEGKEIFKENTREREGGGGGERERERESERERVRE